MIARTGTGPAFAPVARYLAGRDRGIDPARVTWTSSRNLISDDPHLSADLMQATASQNRRVEAPAYQLSLSFAPEDNPTRELVEHVADRVLAELGLGEHQALLVAHHDRKHQHVHALVNRIHPETFAAWDRWQDRAVLDRVLSQAEIEFGLRRVVEHDQRMAERPVSLQTANEPSQDLAVSHRDLATRLRSLLPEIRSAGSWLELRERLQAHGVELERRAHGLVLSDGTSRTKASSLAADVSLSRLESRLGPYTVAPPPEQIRGNEPGRSPYEIEREIDGAKQRLRQVEWAWQRTERSAADVGRALADTVVDPQSAAFAFSRYASSHGDDRAAEALRSHPEQFGTLALTVRKRLFGLWTVTDDIAARTAAAESASLASEWIGHRRQVRELLHVDAGASTKAVNNALGALRETTRDLVARLSREWPIQQLAQRIPTPAKEIGRTLGDNLLGRDR